MNNPMNILRKFIDEKPLITVVSFAFIVIVIQYFPHFLFPDISLFNQYFIGKSLIGLVAVFLMTRLKWWKETRFTSFFHWNSWKFIIPFLLLPVLSASVSDIEIPGIWKFLIIVIYVFIIGFSEEAITRGLFLRILKPYGIWKSVFISSILFGVMHFANMITGDEIYDVLVQVIYATLIGIAFSTIVFYTESIWPTIFIHSLVDFFPQLSPPVTNVPIDFLNALIIIGIQIPFALYGMKLLKNKIQKEKTIQ